MTTTADLTRIAARLAADLPDLSENQIDRLDSDQGLIIQERQTGLRYGREDERMDAVAWRRDAGRPSAMLVLWAGNDFDPDMNWPVELPIVDLGVDLGDMDVFRMAQVSQETQTDLDTP